MTTDDILKLENDITYYAENYYEGTPVITDEEFDKLVLQLKKIDPDNEVLKYTGYGYKVYRDKLSHLSRITGIKDKRRVTADFHIYHPGYIIMPKLDGGSLELVYLKGKLISAVTRGDGDIGVDVTNNVINSKGVISNIDKNFSGNIIGEFVISKEDFDDSNYTSGSIRNIPNGFLSRKQVSPRESELFSFIPYKIGFSNMEFDTKIDILNFFDKEGFIKIPYEESVEYISKSFYSYFNEEFSEIDDLHYLYDGLVLSSNELVKSTKSTHSSSIAVGKFYYPKDEFAYKINNDSVVTKVTDIEWTLTRTGKLSPIAIVSPVYLSGASISRVSVNNLDYLERNHIGIGSSVEVIRSGEIIPYISKVITESSNINLPTNCPQCMSKLVVIGNDLKCVNKECNDFSRVEKFIKTLNNIDGVGSSLINKIISILGCRSIKEFLSLDHQQIINNIIDNISGTKTKKLSIDLINHIFNDYHEFTHILVSLGIPSLSWTTSKKISSDELYYSIKNKDKSKLVDILNNISNISYKTKTYMIDNIDEISTILSLININMTKCYTPDNRIKVCITGSLNGYTKKQFYDKYGNYIEESSVNDCDYLISNSDSNSSKYNKALKLNKHIVSQSDFLSILKRSE